MINFIKQAVESVEGIKSFLFNTDYRNNFDLQNVEFPCCVLTPIMRTNYDLNNIIRESAELQLSVVESAPYDYTGDDLYAINKRCSDLALQVIANLQVKSKLDKELTFEFILPSGDELISGVMCNLTATMKQGSCIGKPSYVEVIVQPIKKESITRNGKHVISPSSGFNAMKDVEVDVNIDIPTIEEKSVDITRNGEVEILPTSADAMTKVTANVQVPPPLLEEKQVTITRNGVTKIVPTSEYGLSKVEVLTDVEPNLQDKSIIISENGTTTIEASEGFEGIESVEVTTDVNTLQGLDFDGVFDQEQMNEMNDFYKDAIIEGGKIKANFVNQTNLNAYLKGYKNFFYFPNIDFKNVTNMSFICQYCSTLVGLPKHLHLPNCRYFRFSFSGTSALIDTEIYLNDNIGVDIYGAFYIAQGLYSVKIYGTRSVKSLNSTFGGAYFAKEIFVENVESCTDFSDAFLSVDCYDTWDQIEIKFGHWKQANVNLNRTGRVSPESIHYIIQNAMNVADGATARTLTLQATAKTNWQNSEYYAQDMAVLTQKGITIA